MERCEVLGFGSCDGPIPDSAESQDSSIQIQTANGFRDRLGYVLGQHDIPVLELLLIVFV